PKYENAVDGAMCVYSSSTCNARTRGSGQPRLEPLAFVTGSDILAVYARTRFSASALQLLVDGGGDAVERRLVDLAGEGVAAVVVDPVEHLHAALPREAKRRELVALVALRHVERESLAARVLVHELRDRAVVAGKQAAPEELED